MLSGEQGLVEAVTHPDVDSVMAAIVGAAAGWAAALVLVDHPLRGEIAAVLRMLAAVAGRRRVAPPPAA